MAIKTQGTELFVKTDANTFTKIGKVTGVTGTGGQKDQIDVSDLDSTDHEYLAGLGNPAAASVQMNFDPSDATHQALETMYQDGTEEIFVIGLSDGTAPPTVVSDVITLPTSRTFIQFSGYIADYPADLNLNDAARSTMQVQRTGARTVAFKA